MARININASSQVKGHSEEPIDALTAATLRALER